MAASSARMPTTSAGMGSQSVPGVSADGRFWGAPQCGQVGAVSCSVVPQPRQKLMVGLSEFGGDYRMIGLLKFAVAESVRDSSNACADGVLAGALAAVGQKSFDILNLRSIKC